MNEETFKKILYLILKVVIKNNGFLSQLEIFRDVRFLMHKYFLIKESDLIVKIGQGKIEDFKDILNFVLTILCELALVSQKMENKSFYFKWNGFKGFRKKYLLELINNTNFKFEMSESFEHRIQIYTRLLILSLYEKYHSGNTGVSYEKIDDLVKHCELENQQRHIEKIHSILRFIDFIIKENIHQTQIFTLHTKDRDRADESSKRGEQIVFKINKTIIDENIIKDTNSAEKFYILFNENILNKYTLWNEEIQNNEKKAEAEFPSGNDINMAEDINSNINIIDNTDIINFDTMKSLGKNEINELEEFRVNSNYFTNDNEDVGFAFLRGNNWCYYIKKLYCIIGRAPIKYGVALNKDNHLTTNYGDTTWQVDVDLGQQRKISKQHALIAYNFQTCSFEIKNLSKKYPIKVNGELIKYNEEMLLSSKSSIVIGNQEFYFLLPI
jgi:hypothetical protein